MVFIKKSQCTPYQHGVFQHKFWNNHHIELIRKDHLTDSTACAFLNSHNFILVSKRDDFENYFFESINLFDSQDLTFSYKNSDNKNSIFDINSSENVIKNKNSFLNLENKDFLDKSYDITFFKYPQIQTSHFTKLYIPDPASSQVPSPLAILAPDS